MKFEKLIVSIESNRDDGPDRFAIGSVEIDEISTRGDEVASKMQGGSWLNFWQGSAARLFKMAPLA